MRQIVEFSNEVLSDSLAVFWYDLFLIGQLLARVIGLYCIDVNFKHVMLLLIR